MEDGSALTPLLASGRQSNAQAASVQHIRLVAALCECPAQSLLNSKQVNQTPASQHLFSAGSLATLSATDESRFNAAMFECLRSKPIELITRKVPLELLHLEPSTGQVLIQSRWLRTSAAGQSSLEDPDELLPVDARQLDRLMLRALDERGSLHSALFGATSALGGRPLFAPVIDGSIVPDEDLAHAMLKPGSHFGLHDLLVGLSSPVLDGSASNQPNTTGKPRVHLSPDLAMAAHVDQQLASTGLTDEQAVEVVGNFARSFYRYHTQEIANSVISHYLDTFSAGLSGRSRHDNLLESLLGAFQDALVNVASLRVAIIHSLKQLELLVEPYAKLYQNISHQSFQAFARQQHDLLSSTEKRSTYLFQLNGEGLAQELKEAGIKVTTGTEDEQKSYQLQRPLSLACSFELSAQTDRNAFERLACARISSTLSSFVASGRLLPGQQSWQDCATEADSGSTQSSCAHEQLVLAARLGELVEDASEWPQFNPFTWQIANLPSSPRRTVEPSADFLSRASFWSNFIPALNCSRTQPIVPSSLLVPTSERSSSLLKLNLLFNCNQQTGTQVARKVQEAFELFEAQALERHRAALVSNRSSSIATTSRHNSRVANMSQSPNGLATDPSAVEPSERAKSEHHNELEVAGRRTLEIQKKYAGLALVACACLLFASLATGVCALVRRRRASQPCRKLDEDSPEVRQGSVDSAAAQGCPAGAVAECKHVNTVEEKSPVEPESHLLLDWPQTGQPTAELTTGLCRSHSQGMLVESVQTTHEPIMVPILSNSIGRQSISSQRKRRVKISDPMDEQQQQQPEEARQLFCPVHQPQLVAVDMNGYYLDSSGQPGAMWPFDSGFQHRHHQHPHPLPHSHLQQAYDTNQLAAEHAFANSLGNSYQLN